MRQWLSAIAINLCLALLAGQSISAQRYTITDLGILPGNTPPSGDTSVGYAVNLFGQVTGYALVPGPCLYECMHAFLYSNGVMHDLGTLPGGRFSVGNGINNQVEVTGFSEVAGGNSHAFLYSEGTMHDLGTFPEGTKSYGFAINQSGQVTGWADTSKRTAHAFLYSDGVMHDIGTLPGGTYAVGYGINDGKKGAKGGVQIVGYGDVPGDCSVDISCPYHAFLYRNGAMHDLGVLPGGLYSEAAAINRSGQVTGSAEAIDGNFHAFLYSNGTMRDLGVMRGGFESFGHGINNYGEIVGYGSVESINDFRAFVYRKGKMQDLNSLIPPNSGWFLANAYAINDRGQITGTGLIGGGEHAYLLDPVCSDNKDNGCPYDRGDDN
jgi:probable HAF family extracellular repeat protein